VSSDTNTPEVPSGMAAVPAAVADVVVGTVDDFKAIPGAVSTAAAFPAKRILLPLLLAQFLNSYDTASMNAAISTIAADLNTTVTGVQTAMAVYTLVMAAGMITGSKLSDIFGRRRIFNVGVMTYGVGALITALSPTILVMALGWSILEGVGSCLMIPPIYILATVNFRDLKSRAAAFGAISAAAAGGSASGPLIGGVITTAVTWRLSFALESIVVVIIIMLRGRITDPGLDKTKPKLDVPGALLSGLGMTGIIAGTLLVGTYGLFTAREDLTINGRVLLQQGQISPAILSILIGLALLIGFAFFERAKERRGGEPLVRMNVVLNRIAATGLSTQSAQWLLSSGIGFVVSVFLQTTFGYSAIQTGLMMIPIIIGVLFFSRRSSKLARKFPAKGILVTGFIVAEIGIGLLILMVDPNGSPLLFIPGLLLIGSGIGIIMPASVNVVQSSATEEEQGDISGVSRSVSNFGSSFGVALAGAVLVSTLVTGITSRANESTVLSSTQKEQINTFVRQNNVSAMSDAQIQQLTEGQPPEVVDEVVGINASARSSALGYALLALAIVGLVGLAASLLSPGRALRTAEQRARGTLDAPEPAVGLQTNPEGLDGEPSVQPPNPAT